MKTNLNNKRKIRSTNQYRNSSGIEKLNTNKQEMERADDRWLLYKLSKDFVLSELTNICLQGASAKGFINLRIFNHNLLDPGWASQITRKGSPIATIWTILKTLLPWSPVLLSGTNSPVSSAINCSFIATIGNRAFFQGSIFHRCFSRVSGTGVAYKLKETLALINRFASW